MFSLFAMHNVRLRQIDKTKKKVSIDSSAAKLHVDLTGEWRSDETKPQFGGVVPFPKGKILFEADFPLLLGGEGRAPTPLAYCFYGAMCCYASTFATQAALVGVEIQSLSISLRLDVDFRTALGVGDFPPVSSFDFLVEVKTSASDAQVQKVKILADKRCPAIWAMDHKVPYTTAVRKSSSKK
ncbi:OsmC family protein [Candidatus Gottesmanbacteria bacterium]|nr:OsmC family protein [Candidatus Gottesmanbacteria bacterium]